MATKKEDKVTEVAEKKVKETKAKKETNKSEMVEVTYIKPRGEKSKHISVSLNGKDYTVPWNEPVKIPVGVKEIIDRSFAAMDYAEAYEDGIAIVDD